MDLNELYLKTFNELKSFGIPVNEAEICIGNLSRNAAKCEKLGENKFRITFMRKLVEANNMNELRKAMAHELIHTCPGTWGHDEKWKSYIKIAEENGHYGLYNAYDYNSLFQPQLPIRSSFYCQKCGVIYDAREKLDTCKCPWCNSKMERVIRKENY